MNCSVICSFVLICQEGKNNSSLMRAALPGKYDLSNMCILLSTRLINKMLYLLIKNASITALPVKHAAQRAVC